MLPSSLTLNPGETKSFNVTFTRTATAPLSTYGGGQLTWTDGTHNVRVPVVVRPVALASPAQVSGSYTVKFGYDGAFTATPRGLIAATTFDGSVSTDPTGVFHPVASPYAVSFDVTIPVGTTYARFGLFDANTTASDLDLYVYDSSNTLVGSSGGSTATEEVNLVNPAAGTYKVWVHGFATANPSPFTLFTWLLVYGPGSGLPNPTIVRVDP